MFWGLAIEPGKRYMQTILKSFHLSMACLEINVEDNDMVPIMLDYDGQEYVLCNLHRHKAMQCSLDLNFKAGEKIAFYSVGKSRVHLSGYILEELDDLEDSDDEDDEEEEEVEQEETSPMKMSPMRKRKDVPTSPASNKKQKLDIGAAEDEEDDSNEMDDDDDDDDDDEFTLEEAEDDDDDDEDDDEDEEIEESDELTTPVKKNLNKSQQNKTPQQSRTPQLNKSQQNKTPGKQQKKEIKGQFQKTPIREQNGQVPSPQTQSGKKNKNKNKQPGGTPKSDSPQGAASERFVAGGVKINDMKVGNGEVAKSGQQVTVYYVGRLKNNNKQFDATTSGPGFKFNLGRSEVIKGWDIGVAGMRVGGKRRITIPPPMAYGKKGQPPVIPPNSALVFEVELRNIH